MMSVSELLASAAANLKTAGVENPRREARLLWQHAVSKNSELIFDSLVQRRVAREPFAYITGEREFWSLSFAVGPGVLVPRPETETLIEEALRRFPDRNMPLRILDLGTGSGCLLLTLLREFPNATGMGIDGSEEALDYAARNAKQLGVESRCQLLNQDWSVFDESAFDLVVSNPPYIESAEIAALSPEVERYEPHAALDGGADGLDAYRVLATLINRFLAPASTALIELGAGQAENVSQIFEYAGFNILGATPDLSGIPRCLKAHISGTVLDRPIRNCLETAA